jgi:hypothetical protein
MHLHMPSNGLRIHEQANDVEMLVLATDACFDCAQACRACAEACLGEKKLDELRIAFK